MERYQVILAYDGTDFHGSQFQANARTVQGVLEDSLRKLNWMGKSVLFAGRTDAGVHATGQVAAFDLDWNHSLSDLKNALNSLLPRDVSVLRIFLQNPVFQPRFDAVSRTYVYRIYCMEVRNPLLDRFSWRVWPQPNIDRLNNAAALFIGVHDFAGYGRPTSDGGSTIREIMTMSWQGNHDRMTLTITGNAFLYRMVRRLSYAQVMTAQGKLDISVLIHNLHHPGEETLKGLAPARGLTLVRVDYPEDQGKNG